MNISLFNDPILVHPSASNLIFVITMPDNTYSVEVSLGKRLKMPSLRKMNTQRRALVAVVFLCVTRLDSRLDEKPLSQLCLDIFISFSLLRFSLFILLYFDLSVCLFLLFLFLLLSLFNFQFLLLFLLQKFAKSSRSKCRKCKEPILKGDVRIVTTIPGDKDGYDVKQNVHPACFSLPRKYSTGADKMTPTQFLEDIVHDESSGGEILPAQLETLAAAIAAKSGGGGTKTDQPAEGSVDAFMEPIKAAWTAAQQDNETADAAEPKKKKAKKDVKPPPAATAVQSDNKVIIDDALLQAYGVYHSRTNDELKDILKWNRTMSSGKKNLLLVRCMDGHLRGRLALCSLCGGGRLKLSEDMQHVHCNGKYDEDTEIRIECSYRASATEAPRWQPW